VTTSTNAIAPDGHEPAPAARRGELEALVRARAGEPPAIVDDLLKRLGVGDFDRTFLIAAHADAASNNGGRAAEPAVAGEPADANQEQRVAIQVYTARDLADLELPTPADPLVGPFLRRGMATLIGGLTGHGKTTWIYQLLAAAVLGRVFLGERGAGGLRALVLDLEQHLASVQRNIREAGLDGTNAVDFAPLSEGLALDKRPDQLDALEAIFASGGYDIVAVDPFFKLHESDSSDELQARLLVAVLRRWINDYGFGLLSATHCRKLPAGRTTITLDDLFGSSLFTRDPEIVLGIQRGQSLTKLHVFKSREPGLDHGQVFELLYARDRGFWLKPNVDPEERTARLDAIGAAAVEWIAEHPGESTNKVKRGVGSAQRCGGDLVEEALERQVKSGLLPSPIKGSRQGNYWYPLNHAALTSPGTLLGGVTEGARQAGTGATSPGLPDLYVVGEGSQAGEVAEASPAADELEWK
jgi:hypothetical protein